VFDVPFRCHTLDGFLLVTIENRPVIRLRHLHLVQVQALQIDGYPHPLVAVDTDVLRDQVAIRYLGLKWMIVSPLFRRLHGQLLA